MAGAGPDDLQQLAQQYLDACALALQDTAEGPPDCQFISPGPPAWDTCPCLMVHTSGPAIADTYPLVPSLAPGHRMAVQGLVNIVSVTATILRCVPGIDEDGTLPTPAENTAAAAQTNSDLWAIWSRLSRWKREGTIFPPDTREMSFDPAIAVVNQGLCGGWQITARIQLDAYKR